MSEETRTFEEAEENQVVESKETESDSEENKLSDDDSAEPESSLEEQLAEAHEKAAEYLDGWQRARAEFANARKRLERDRAEAYQNASVDFARRLLPAIDDFERATENVPESIAEDSWYQGMLMIQRKLESLLENLKVERIQAIGEEFDPNFHEALQMKEQEGTESGIVIEELQTGYRIGEKVIRPALVNVAA